MVFLKGFLFGLGGAVLASVLWITLRLVLPLFLPYAIGRLTGRGGVSSGYVASDSILIAALIDVASARPTSPVSSECP